MPEDPQSKEEFLRDIIAIIQGQPSPEFYPNQAAVRSEVDRIISMIPQDDMRAKRTLLRQLETQWRNAKELAVAWANRKFVQQLYY